MLKTQGIVAPRSFEFRGLDVMDIWQFLPETHYGSAIVTTRSLSTSIGWWTKVDKLEDICDSLQILPTRDEDWVS